MDLTEKLIYQVGLHLPWFGFDLAFDFDFVLGLSFGFDLGFIFLNKLPSCLLNSKQTISLVFASFQEDCSII